VALLLAVVAALPLLTHASGGLGAVRWAGVSLTWWYAGLGAPLGAALLAALVLALARE
jgi:hypothetical protein